MKINLGFTLIFLGYLFFNSACQPTSTTHLTRQSTNPTPGPTYSPSNQNAGPSTTGGGFQYENSIAFLRIISNNLAGKVERMSPRVFSGISPGIMNKASLAKLIKNIKFKPDESKSRQKENGQSEGLMFDYGWDNDEPYIAAMNPFFEAYRSVPIDILEERKFLQPGQDKKDPVIDLHLSYVKNLEIRILHESAHFLGKSDTAARSFANRIYQAIEQTRIECKRDLSKTSPDDLAIMQDFLKLTINNKEIQLGAEDLPSVLRISPVTGEVRAQAARTSGAHFKVNDEDFHSYSGSITAKIKGEGSRIVFDWREDQSNSLSAKLFELKNTPKSILFKLMEPVSAFLVFWTLPKANENEDELEQDPPKAVNKMILSIQTWKVDFDWNTMKATSQKLLGNKYDPNEDPAKEKDSSPNYADFPGGLKAKNITEYYDCKDFSNDGSVGPFSIIFSRH